MFVRGVTLLEILVVLLVVAVVAAVAVPAYRHHMVRVNRGGAMVALHDIAAAQERHYLRAARYATDLSAAPPSGLGMAVESRHYAYSLAVADDGQSFIATATPTRDGGQGSDGECLAFSIDHRGRRAVTGSRGVEFCWR